MEFPIELPVPDSSDRIVLDDYMTSVSTGGNLARLDASGAELWRALPVGDIQDAWVNVAIEGPRLRAATWAGWSVVLDIATGAEISRLFAK
ncbi:hypothetical protein GCM10009547_11110 [Sporichthya brevicatena]|uniref:Uncharacterized protein n=1 Tax=Sporichthya brevicatena TaxID=171442 RepID=A0ABN1GG82_9ACTN